MVLHKHPKHQSQFQYSNQQTARHNRFNTNNNRTRPQFRHRGSDQGAKPHLHQGCLGGRRLLLDGNADGAHCHEGHHRIHLHFPANFHQLRFAIFCVGEGG